MHSIHSISFGFEELFIILIIGFNVFISLFVCFMRKENVVCCICFQMMTRTNVLSVMMTLNHRNRFFYLVFTASVIIVSFIG